MSERVQGIREQDYADQQLVDEIRSRRGGVLLNLDRVLLQSPAVADGWNRLFGALRKTNHPLTRESVILFIAVLNEAEYEWDQHIDPFREAGGTGEMETALREGPGRIGDESVFSSLQSAALRVAFEMTTQIKVADESMAALSACLDYNDKELLDLICVIAGYNMVSRVLVATKIHPETSL